MTSGRCVHWSPVMLRLSCWLWAGVFSRMEVMLWRKVATHSSVCVGCSTDGFCFDFNVHFCQTEKRLLLQSITTVYILFGLIWFFYRYPPLNPNIKCQKTLLLYILISLFFFQKEVVYMYICYQLFVYDFKVNKNYDLFLIKVVRVDCLMLLWINPFRFSCVWMFYGFIEWLCEICTVSDKSEFGVYNSQY